MQSLSGSSKPVTLPINMAPVTKKTIFSEIVKLNKEKMSKKKKLKKMLNLHSELIELYDVENEDYLED